MTHEWVSTLRVEKGVCYALLAYDIGLSIDLDEAERRITAFKERGSIRPKRRAPSYFEFRPPPLRVTQEAESLKLGDYSSGSTVDVMLFDFGALSVTYRISLEGYLDNLLDMSEELYENPQLLNDPGVASRSCWPQYKRPSNAPRSLPLSRTMSCSISSRRRGRLDT